MQKRSCSQIIGIFFLLNVDLDVWLPTTSVAKQEHDDLERHFVLAYVLCAGRYWALPIIISSTQAYWNVIGIPVLQEKRLIWLKIWIGVWCVTICDENFGRKNMILYIMGNRGLAINFNGIYGFLMGWTVKISSKFKIWPCLSKGGWKFWRLQVVLMGPSILCKSCTNFDRTRQNW